MAVTRLQELASGEITDPGSATEGPAINEAWEVRAITVYGGGAVITTEEDVNDDGTFAKSSDWATLADAGGGGLSGEAEPIVGGSGTNPKERIKIASDGADIAYIIKGRVHS